MKQQGFRRSLTRCTEHHRCNWSKQAVTMVTTIKWQKRMSRTKRRYFIGRIFVIYSEICSPYLQCAAPGDQIQVIISALAFLISLSQEMQVEHTRLHTHTCVYIHLLQSDRSCRWPEMMQLFRTFQLFRTHFQSKHCWVALRVNSCWIPQLEGDEIMSRKAGITFLKFGQAGNVIGPEHVWNSSLEVSHVLLNPSWFTLT